MLGDLGYEVSLQRQHMNSMNTNAPTNSVKSRSNQD
jgi:hypothetical protein